MGACRHKDTAQSSCQSEIHSINETTKLLLSIKLFFRDINIPLNTTIPIHNDNQGAVMWSKGTTTKKMKWIDLRENFVRENVLNGNIKVCHIPGVQNTSDIFTKEFRDTTHFLQARDSFMIDSKYFSQLIPTTNKQVTFSKISNTKSYKSALTNSVRTTTE